MCSSREPAHSFTRPSHAPASLSLFPSFSPPLTSLSLSGLDPATGLPVSRTHTHTQTRARAGSSASNKHTPPHTHTAQIHGDVWRADEEGRREGAEGRGTMVLKSAGSPFPSFLAELDGS